MLCGTSLVLKKNAALAALSHPSFIVGGKHNLRKCMHNVASCTALANRCPRLLVASLVFFMTQSLHRHKAVTTSSKYIFDLASSPIVVPEDTGYGSTSSPLSADGIEDYS